MLVVKTCLRQLDTRDLAQEFDIKADSEHLSL